MSKSRRSENSMLASAAVMLLAGTAFAQSWVEFTDETASRLDAPGSIGVVDPDEKDYAFADLDQDGDIDLVCVRKQPFTSTGRRINALFMNENGVLTDRTLEFASATDVPGDQGFLTPTNDRDVVIVDVDNDGWLDIVTCTTLTDNQPKSLSHPRVYMNLGNDGGGNWQGFRFEDARIPQMHPTAGPRFCSVASGDIDEDGDMDLYFGDYDSGPAQIFDYNNRVLINDGNGFFSDLSTTVLPQFAMRESAFGAASVIVDMNNDGALDVVKQTALVPPQHVAVTYNNPANKGIYNAYDVVDSDAPYFVSVGDLNNDARPDMVVSDDGFDHFWLNQGNNGSGQADFVSKFFQYQGAGDGGFAGDSYIVDLDNDGWNDVIITDVDVDESGCSRRTRFFHNQGDAPDVTLLEEIVGSTSASIPFSLLDGVHNIAVFDINQDGWLDMVMGYCDGTKIWMNTPPIDVAFDFPGGVPTVLSPDQPTVIDVTLTPVGGTLNHAAAQLTYSIDGAPDVTIPMTHVSGNNFQATLPAVPCPQDIQFEFAAALNAGGSFSSPSNGRYTALSADSFDNQVEAFEADVPNWTVTSQALTAGAWERAVPVGTINAGAQAAPNADTTADGTFAFVTQNGAPGGAASAADLDGGPTRLTSPTIDLSGSNAVISYSRWFYCNQQGAAGADTLITEVSNDNGATWVTVSSTDGTNSGAGTPTQWQSDSFIVSAFVTPTDQVRVRFTTSDNPNGSVTEAAIDDFTVGRIVCPTPSCRGDIANDDGLVNVDDLNVILSNFGQNVGVGHPADLANNDGTVDIDDLNVILSAFGSAC